MNSYVLEDEAADTIEFTTGKRIHKETPKQPAGCLSVLTVIAILAISSGWIIL